VAVSEFSYIDIFATKGLEYLLVIGFFLLLAGFWWLLSVPKKEIRKAQAEREELRKLLDLQRDRMESEISKLRDQREDMQNALLAQIQLLEQKALEVWYETHAEASAPPDLVKLLDWVLAERQSLARDAKRLDHLAGLAQRKVSLYPQSEPDGSIVLEMDGEGVCEGATLREAIDAAQTQGGA
jgi:hypothetical protein